MMIAKVCRHAEMMRALVCFGASESRKILAEMREPAFAQKVKKPLKDINDIPTTDLRPECSAHLVGIVIVVPRMENTRGHKPSHRDQITSKVTRTNRRYGHGDQYDATDHRGQRGPDQKIRPLSEVVGSVAIQDQPCGPDEIGSDRIH